MQDKLKHYVFFLFYVNFLIFLHLFIYILKLLCCVWRTLQWCFESPLALRRIHRVAIV